MAVSFTASAVACSPLFSTGLSGNKDVLVNILTFLDHASACDFYFVPTLREAMNLDPSHRQTLFLMLSLRKVHGGIQSELEEAEQRG